VEIQLEILDTSGAHVGQGLTRYTSTEATVLKGHKTAEIAGLLGYAGRAALIHRDDMAL
jgi:glutamate 5-kinase